MIYDIQSEVRALVVGLDLRMIGSAPAQWEDIAEDAMAEYRERTGRDYSVRGVPDSFLHLRVVNTLRHEYTTYQFALDTMGFRAFEMDASEDSQREAKRTIQRELHRLIANQYPDLASAAAQLSDLAISAPILEA